jgi:hypothetical protein
MEGTVYKERKMKKVISGCFLVVGMLAVPTFVKAQDTASATLTVTGTVVSSITMTIESAGGTFTQGGTSAALSDLGSISKFGAIPTGFTRATTGSTWTLSSSIGVKVQKANSISTAYTLNAKLATAPATGVIWTVNAVALTTGIQALTAAGSYVGTPSYAWSIQIPDSLATASAIDNVIQFSAISG